MPLDEIFSCFSALAAAILLGTKPPLPTYKRITATKVHECALECCQLFKDATQAPTNALTPAGALDRGRLALSATPSHATRC